MEKIKEIKEEETIQSFLNRILWQIVSFGTALTILTLFFMGALGAKYDIPVNDFITPTIGNLTKAANITITTFYMHGYKQPTIFICLFYLGVFMTFIYPIYQVIMFFIKRKKRKNEKK
jgi:uncharacterized membrane protein